jgi:hypothetical protein
MTRPRLLILALAAVALTSCQDLPAGTAPTRPVPLASATPTQSVDRPDENITPGTVITTQAADVCTPGWATAHRDKLTVTQERQVLDAYRLPTAWATQTGHVSEWDHLISLQLGGGNGTRNIWPQLDHTQDQRKDRLETRLHVQVCHGQLSLQEAQNRIKTFWRYW